MPRVNFVQKARKDNPAVKAGEPYYWWKFRYGGKHYSKTSPTRSQLTQSSFLSQIYDIEDDILGKAEANYEVRDASDLDVIREDAVSQLEELKSEVEDNLENIPEQLQDSHMLSSRLEAVEEMLSELENLDFDDYSGPDLPPGEDGELPQEFFDWKDDKVSELSYICYGGE